MKILKTIYGLFPHMTFILSIMFVTFLILDQYNPMINFVDNSISMVLLLIMSILTLVNSIVIIIFMHQNNF
ncbi:MAG TPA: hypothetical protein PLU43_03130 [Lachnospiraceae bacterium]|nr:hypothetical protein [Lachnospiraceae bacterium]